LTGTYFTEFLTMWTMHNWTSTLGNTAVIVSGNPVRPSTAAMSVSYRLRVFNSFIMPIKRGSVDRRSDTASLFG
jgi:hypothetical protein